MITLASANRSTSRFGMTVRNSQAVELWLSKIPTIPSETEGYAAMLDAVRGVPEGKCRIDRNDQKLKREPIVGAKLLFEL